MRSTSCAKKSSELKNNGKSRSTSRANNAVDHRRGGRRVFSWAKKPKSAVTKILGAIIGVFATLSGLWLALLDIGIGARIIGLLVGVAGLRLLLKIFKRNI